MVCWNLRYADWGRAQDRALINRLANGASPYSQKEVQDNNISVNVNDLTMTRLAHDARAQFYGAMMRPGQFFTCRTDGGVKHKRDTYNRVVTKEINRVMKRSIKYFEKSRNTIASDVLHGIGAGHWDRADRWCPRAKGVEDVFIPSGTLLEMDNLPLFAIWQSYTANQFITMVRGSHVDPGWNQPFAEEIIKWIDAETAKLLGTTWPEYLSPEKAEERSKGDTSFYSSDQCPTVDVFDFYYWDDAGEDEGWRRRMILDSWGSPAATGGAPTRKSGDIFRKDQFLYNSGDKKFGNRLQELVSFQFADLSAVSPFRYHTVRSLGFLLYAVCHIQNRLHCKLTEATFEALTMYYRVQSSDDVQRALKIELGQGFIDESVKFLTQAERWIPNAQMIELGISSNEKLLQQNSGIFSPQSALMHDKTEKTKFETMAKLNAATALVSAALNQAYAYQELWEYPEIFRRFCLPPASEAECGTTDPDILSFRAAVMRKGVPAKLLVAEAWDLAAVKVMGGGNKTMEMAIAEQLMTWRPMFDPEPQRSVLREAVFAVTDDPARAEALVPEEAVHVSDSMHDAQLAAGALLQGLPVALKTGINHIEYVDTMLVNLQLLVAKAKQRGGMATAEQIEGMQRIAQNIVEHIQVIAQDKNEKQRVKQYGDVLAKAMNEIRAMAQRLQQQMQQQNGHQGDGMDPKDKAKIAATIMHQKTKDELAAKSHGQRTAQKQIQFEQKMRQDAQKHLAEIGAKDLETEASISRMRSTEE